MSETTFTSRETGVNWPKGDVYTFVSPSVTDPHQALYQDQLIAAAKSTQPGTFLLDRRYLPGISDLATRAHFIEIAEHGETREASGHGVVFGQLMLHSVDDGEHSLYVAIKPLDQVEEAAQEYGVGSFFASGNVPGVTTFTPTGFYTLDTGQPAVISRYRHPVRSLDTIFWNPETIGNKAMTAKAMGRAATTLATLHMNHWARGDAQAKNFAWDVTRPTGDTVLIDLETVEPFPLLDNGALDDVAAAELINNDLESFIGSLFHLRDMGKALPEDFEEQIKQDFCLVYSGYQDMADGSNMVPTYHDIAEIVDEQARYTGA